jgi:hypothetical protein
VEKTGESHKVDDGTHLHVFRSGSSGKDRLLSVLQSEYTSSVLQFKNKNALYVDEERCQQELLYSDFIRYKNEVYITSAVHIFGYWIKHMIMKTLVILLYMLGCVIT